MKWLEELKKKQNKHKDHVCVGTWNNDFQRLIAIAEGAENMDIGATMVPRYGCPLCRKRSGVHYSYETHDGIFHEKSCPYSEEWEGK